jgi:2-keto-4-pentenoate hydratase
VRGAPGRRSVVDPRVRRGLEAQLARWRATVDGGAARVGWKIGLNDRRVQERLGLDATVVGHLTLATTLVPGVPHPLAGTTFAAAEAEVSIHLARDVEAGASPADALGAVEGLGAAIEVVDVDGPIEDVERIVARNVYHRAVLFGPTRPAASLDGVVARIAKNGADVTVRADVDVAGTVRLVADTLAAVGERLLAGDRIIAGSLGPPLRVAPGDVVEVTMGPLGALRLAFVA